MKKLTEEHKRKIAEAHRGKSSGMLGKKHSEETKQKMMQSHTGKKHSDETKQKMAEKRALYWKKMKLAENNKSTKKDSTIAGLKIVKFE